MRAGTVISTCIALLVVIGFLTHNSRSIYQWSHLFETGCREGIFGFAGSQLPEFISEALPEQSRSNKRAQVLDTIRRAVYTFAQTARPGVPVNINCDIGPFLRSGLNVYVVAEDDPRFAFARGNAITIAAPINAIILGYGYQNLFSGAWETAASRAERLELARSTMSDSNRAALDAMIEASAEFSFESYLIYTEWMIAHEMGHLFHNHPRPNILTMESSRVVQEREADRFGARLLFLNYTQIRAHLQGLLYDAMLENFSKTTGRDWTSEDGFPFTLEGGGGQSIKITVPKWPICVPEREGHYDHFVIRTLDMLDALSSVSQEDVAAISAIESQLNSTGSSLQMLRDSAWQRSIAILVENVHSRLILVPRDSEGIHWNECRFRGGTQLEN